MPKVCQAIQTAPIQPQLEQNDKAAKPHNQATSPTLPQDPRSACQTLRKGLYLSGLVGFCWTELTGELLWQSFSRTQFTTRTQTTHRTEGWVPAPRLRSTAHENSTRVRCGGYWLITGRTFSRFTNPAMESLTTRSPCSRPRSWKSSCVAGTRTMGSLGQHNVAVRLDLRFLGLAQTRSTPRNFVMRC